MNSISSQIILPPYATNPLYQIISLSCNHLGKNLLFRIFLKRAIMENGIPFRMTLPQAPYNAERGYRAMVELGEASEKNGLSDMSLDEINAEIEASGNARRVSNQ